MNCDVVATEASGVLIGALELGRPFRVDLMEARAGRTLYLPLISH